ncbi:glycosyltransferase [Mangrovibrevibacter kandeliae]|uniref:glycosyltransferase n=1 Tax=Mangrovibrevibacter kandeliae TaxID=2968473 RepID=UPI0021178EF1|nr:glycosyltransferase [Aurantimonas sp. CSK15Z-1]MCQ8782822.1 glycosyltransferase [Aurantimonas sp. CSK15Z-1]
MRDVEEPAETAEKADPLRVMFLYWGRRGPLSRLTLDLVRSAGMRKDFRASVSVSRSNELYRDFEALGPVLHPVSTFGGASGAVLGAWRLPLLRHQLAQRLRRDGTEVVVTLMPHVWTPFIVPAVRAAGARYATVVHDALPHPGDRLTALAQTILSRDAGRADLVLTLSETVSRQLRARALAAPVHTLFHPLLPYRTGSALTAPQDGNPWRLLFFGRILPYKGLPLFVDMVETLVAAGLPVEAGVFGAGDLGDSGPRLRRLGAEIVNRWIAEDEIAPILARHHVMILSHTEASQSGVAAAALGSGMPVVATPVGGLPEQIEHGVTGLVARDVSAEALAAAVTALVGDRGIYGRMVEAIEHRQSAASLPAFLDALHEAIVTHARD